MKKSPPNEWYWNMTIPSKPHAVDSLDLGEKRGKGGGTPHEDTKISPFSIASSKYSYYLLVGALEHCFYMFL